MRILAAKDGRLKNSEMLRMSISKQMPQPPPGLASNYTCVVTPQADRSARWLGPGGAYGRPSGRENAAMKWLNRYSGQELTLTEQAEGEARGISILKHEDDA